MAAFIAHVNARRGLNLPLEYAPLREWSVLHAEDFWGDIWDFFAVSGDKGSGRTENPRAMPGARFFADASLNFAENLLRDADDTPALISWTEKGAGKTLTRADALWQTRRLAGYLRANGARAGDSICAYMPNIPETVIAFLAASSLGAVFSSCSMDFGPEGAAERFGQTAPKFLIAADGYEYNGRAVSRTDAVIAAAKLLPSLQKIITVPFLGDSAPPPGGIFWEDVLAGDSAEFVRGDFNAPLLALFSSGTTGAPKCIIHGAGGVLLQHLKELALHGEINSGDRVFYFTTCGWMMWNWLISALALKAAPVLYEGNPLHPSPAVLWDMAQAENISLFGVSAKYLDVLRKAEIAPARTHSLPALRTVCSTGSPLSAEGFDYVYEKIKPDVQLASISGGTDIVSCFALGNPLDSVRRGELQCRGLGMAVAVYDDAGKEITDAPGELVCTAPFPSMPLKFARDPDGAKYRAAYFEHFPGAWRHGDWAVLTAGGGMTILGRSDATLNPGGVRIGTAEIYRAVESLAEVAEALAVGQEWEDDTRIALFVRLAAGAVLDGALRARIRAAVRAFASPRHVPAKIAAVADFPRTRSGKTSEIAVREAIHGRPVKNINALANPESLELFRNLPELAD